MANPIVAENTQPGNSGWNAPKNDRITGYADAASVNVGQTIRFAVSTTSVRFDLAVYRLGWYHDDGGRLIFSHDNITGTNQGYWAPKTYGVASCSTCQVDPLTGLLDANWAWSYSLAIPKTWTSGVYVARLYTSDGDSGAIPFIVRNDALRADVLAVLPVNTWQAYNLWGGKSLYASSAYGPPTMAGDVRAVKVSFNRPYAVSAPTSQDTNVISFLERFGYDASYATDVDIDGHAELISSHRVYLAVGHDEYWSKPMRDAVESARDNGISLAFLGGNDIYWQARYEPDAAGHLRRTLVVYRSASLDPAAVTEPKTVTVIWSAPPVNRPQNALTGTLFSDGYPPASEPWVLGKDPPQWLLRGTGLRPGDVVPDLESGECDRAQADRASPPSLIILGSAHFTTRRGKQEHCDSTWYSTDHQSAVFSAGDLGWPNLLAGPASDDRVIALTRNVLDRLNSGSLATAGRGFNAGV